MLISMKFENWNAELAFVKKYSLRRGKRSRIGENQMLTRSENKNESAEPVVS